MEHEAQLLSADRWALDKALCERYWRGQEELKKALNDEVSADHCSVLKAEEADKDGDDPL